MNSPTRSARAALAVALAVACTKKADDDELQLRRRSGDAGPAVVIVERAGAAGGAAVDENEPNDARRPQAVVLPGAVRGALGGTEDRDVYVVTLPSSGTLRAVLTPQDAKSDAPGGRAGKRDRPAGADLVLDIADAGGKVLVSSDNGPAGTAEAVPNLFAQPGKLTVVVRAYVKRARRGRTKRRRASAADAGVATGTPYLLELELGPPPAAGEEREPNDDLAFAGELALGASGRGFVGWRKDRDAWKVPLDGVGQDEGLQIDIDGVPGVALRVEVLDGTGASLLSRRFRAGEPASLRNVAVRVGEPHYFVSVTGDRGSGVDPYVVRASSKPFELDEEAEPNDTTAAANPLSDVPGAETGTRVGFLGPRDVDAYRLDAAPAPRLLDLVLEPPGGIDVELVVLGPGDRRLGLPADAGKRGAVERLVGVAVPTGAPVVVRVATKGGASETERYRLRWTVRVPENDAAESDPGAAGFRGDPSATGASDPGAAGFQSGPGAAGAGRPGAGGASRPGAAGASDDEPDEAMPIPGLDD